MLLASNNDLTTLTVDTIKSNFYDDINVMKVNTALFTLHVIECLT